MRVSLREGMRIAVKNQDKVNRKKYRQRYIRIWSNYQQMIEPNVDIRTMVMININSGKVFTGTYPVLYGMGGNKADVKK